MVKEGGAWKPIDLGRRAARSLSQRIGEARSRGGAGNAVFINQHETGSFPAFLDEWLAGFGMRPHLSVDFEADSAVVEANRAAVRRRRGRARRSSDARLIVSFGADFLDGWGASRAAAARLRRCARQARRARRGFIYIGPRRSLTGLNADQWIACRARQRARHRECARAVSGVARRGGATASGVARGDARRACAASSPRRSRRSCSRGARGRRCARRRAGRRGAQPGRRRRRHHDQARRGDAPASTASRARPTSLAAVERMRAGAVPHRVRARREPRVLAARRRRKFAEAFAKVPFKVSFSMLPRRDDRAVRPRPPGPALARVVGRRRAGARHDVAAAAGDGSGVPSTRATADVLIAGRAEGSGATRRATRRPTIALADRRASRAATPAFAAALAEGHRLGQRRTAHGAGAGRRDRAQAAQPHRRHARRLLPRHLSVAGARRRPRREQAVAAGAARSRHQGRCGARGSRSIRRRRARLGIERGDIVEVTTAAGNVTRAGVPLSRRSPRHGRGRARPGPHGRDASRRSSRRRRTSRDAVGLRPLRARHRRQRARSRAAADAAAARARRRRRPSPRPATTSPLVTTEGSARQHGRGIAQAIDASPSCGRAEPREAQAHDIPGCREPRVPPGTALAGRGRRAGRARRSDGGRSGQDKGMYARTTERHGEAPLGDDDRPRALHRLLGVRHRVLRREQHSDGRRAVAGRARVYADANGPGVEHHARPRDGWMRLERYFEGGRDGEFTRGLRDALRADAVPALRQRAVRAGVPGVRDVSRARRPQRAGLQPLRRHALLLEQLPVQGSLLQLVRVRRAGSHAVRVPRAAQLAAQSRRHGARQGRHGEVHVLRAAHPRSGERARSSRIASCSPTSSRRRARRRVRRARSCSATRPIRTGRSRSWSQDRRAYHVFEELNTFTAVVYLKKVNHPAAGAPRRGALGEARRWHRTAARVRDERSARTSRRRTIQLPGGPRLRAGRSRDHRRRSSPTLRLVRRARHRDRCAC